MPVRFLSPPGWPTTSAGSWPPAGWIPDPSWPQAPPGWVFYRDDAGAPVATPADAWSPALAHQSSGWEGSSYGPGEGPATTAPKKSWAWLWVAAATLTVVLVIGAGYLLFFGDKNMTVKQFEAMVDGSVIAGIEVLDTSQQAGQEVEIDRADTVSSCGAWQQNVHENMSTFFTGTSSGGVAVAAEHWNSSAALNLSLQQSAECLDQEKQVSTRKQGEATITNGEVSWPDGSTYKTVLVQIHNVAFSATYKDGFDPDAFATDAIAQYEQAIG